MSPHHDKLVSVLKSCKTPDQIHSWLGWCERILKNNPFGHVYQEMGHNRLLIKYGEEHVIQSRAS